jgi:hypothetical protein
VKLESATALLTGSVALAGGLGGVLLASLLTRRADRARLKAVDDRRWLNDRRTVYAQYLGLTEAMLREIDGVAVFLPYSGGEPIGDDEEELIHEGLLNYMIRWDDRLQPALSEVQLLATPSVSDLADRMSSALMDLTAEVERRGAFVNHYPMWFQAKDLHHVLRDAMREELGLTKMPEGPFKLEAEWPWLPDRPSRDSYIQQHAGDRRQHHEGIREDLGL